MLIGPIGARCGADNEGSEFILLNGRSVLCGCYSAFAGFAPTTGNQFHHAVELFLKGALAKNGSSLDDLKKLGHNLPKIWEAFKATFNDNSFDQFDNVITSLHRFEDIRYPELIVEQGMMAVINITKQGQAQTRFRLPGKNQNTNFACRTLTS